MELNDALRRVIAQRWLLILAAVAAAMAVATALQLRHSPTYTASARLVLDTSDPQTQSESAAIADTAQALATSPSVIQRSLREARLTGRDPRKVADATSISALGSSGVLQLSVTDRSARVAQALAAAIAHNVIATRLGVTRGTVDQSLTKLDRQIAQLSQQVAGYDTTIDSLTLQIAKAGAGAVPGLTAQRDNATRLRDLATQRRSVLDAQRSSLLTSDAMRPDPAILSPASLPTQANSSALALHLILAAVIGLLLGVGLSAIIETLRPTLVGGDSIAHELDVPLLGELDGTGDSPTGRAAIVDAGVRIMLAARAAGVRSVGLLSARQGMDLGALARGLQPADRSQEAAVAAAAAYTHGGPPQARPEPSHAEQARQYVRIADVRADQLGQQNGMPTGLVVVAPPSIRRAELTDVGHLMRITDAPLLGVVTWRRPAVNHAKTRKDA